MGYNIPVHPTSAHVERNYHVYSENENDSNSDSPDGAHMVLHFSLKQNKIGLMTINPSLTSISAQQPTT